MTYFYIFYLFFVADHGKNAENISIHVYIIPHCPLFLQIMIPKVTSMATTINTGITVPTMVATFGAVVTGMVDRMLSVVILIVKLTISRFTKIGYQQVTK